MRTLFGRGETRSAQGGGYTALRLTEQLAAASTGNAGIAGGLGAVEHCAGAWSRSLSLCTVRPDGARELAGCDAAWLALCGRDLATSGNHYSLIVFDRGKLRLVPCFHGQAYGSATEWRYSLSLSGPSSDTTRMYPAREVVHVRYAATGFQPWRGRSPLAAASATGRLAYGATRSGADEFAIANVRILQDRKESEPPDEMTNETVADASARLRTVMDGGGVFYAKPLEVQTVHAEPGDGTSDLLECAERSIYGAYGLPAVLADYRAPGNSLREGWRVYRQTIAGLAKLVEGELREKLTPEATIDTSGTKISDISAETRSYKQLKESGMPDAEIREILGWPPTSVRSS